VACGKVAASVGVAFRVGEGVAAGAGVHAANNGSVLASHSKRIRLQMPLWVGRMSKPPATKNFKRIVGGL
jgi:hypothetical protein